MSTRGSKPLPADGPHRRIFLEALRDYSDACEAPMLTPSCPFFELTPTGPSCGEQCHDLLAAHDAVPTCDAGYSIGDGLALVPKRRPRARRGPEPTAKPFDAIEIRLRDEERPRSMRHTVSLMVELHSAILTCPWISDDREERTYVVRACFEELTRRGIDVDGLVRSGMRDEIAQAVGVIAAMPFLAATIPAERLPLLGLRDENDWSRLLRQYDGPGVEGSSEEESALHLIQEALAGPFKSRLVRWVLHADWLDLTEWRPPAVDNFHLDASSDEANVIAENHWLLERFIKTYLTDWHQQSLHLEWRFLHSQVAPMSPPSVMSTRRVEAGDLAREISHRAVAEVTKPDNEKGSGDFVKTAVDFLQSGRRPVAAALFEALRHRDPDNAEAHNNFGFCILPDDPAAALEALQQADALGYGMRETNIANRIYALMRLNRLTEALQLAEVACAEVSSTPTVPAYLWSFTSNDPGNPDLLSPTDPISYVIGLAAHIAQAAHDEAALGFWKARDNRRTPS